MINYYIRMQLKVIVNCNSKVASRRTCIQQRRFSFSDKCFLKCTLWLHILSIYQPVAYLSKERYVKHVYLFRLCEYFTFSTASVYWYGIFMQSLLSIRNMSEQNTEYLFSRKESWDCAFSFFFFSTFISLQLFFDGNALIKYKLYESSEFFTILSSTLYQNRRGVSFPTSRYKKQL